MESNVETMDAKLNAILEKYVVGKDLGTNQKLIGASFAVVTKDRKSYYTHSVKPMIHLYQFTGDSFHLTRSHYRVLGWPDRSYQL